MKCIFCKGETVQKTVEYKEHGIILGKFSGQVCSSCGEIFFDAETAKKIQEKSKEKGLFGLSKKVKIGKVGDSLMIRIPKNIAKFAKLKEGKEVRMSPQGDKIIIEN